jgi:hypothetical protein
MHENLVQSQVLKAINFFSPPNLCILEQLPRAAALVGGSDDDEEDENFVLNLGGMIPFDFAPRVISQQFSSSS